uniref:structural maintenance of chromosomes protein 3-like isoform X2 n=1 Tax=Ciona intestinalis TaxID=7719 RepID=UPI00089DAEB5|nr:structural maintenance of chromosomes protein 3-like isoform X2 [Ciona intestinalis]|eukprot:XP_018670625.1 structural maintenance of chromosomes protein 3-like isoform X2 [Ciona intestinalis]
MLICQVSIQGFRSYRESTEIEPFSSRHNIIVGRNGSGKSNFFCAIQFVLSDEYNNLRAEQRQQLLHEGTGTRVISACVEIIFENSDNRLPIDKDEVTLRRVIGSKKDQYFLDKKMVTKNDVLNLLESAGFSRSNPYYIVKQGKINQMATAPDSYRLHLLREVAGTRVYDERKKESEVLMKESEMKNAKIQELLTMIEDRLATLKDEKEELAQYQKWDKTRRGLEYTIHNQELNETRGKIDLLSNKRENNSQQTKHLRAQQEEAQRRTKEFQKKLLTTNARIRQLTEEKEQSASDRQELIKKKAQLELSSNDLAEELDSDERSMGQARSELSGLREKILKKTEEKEEIIPRFEAVEGKEKELERRLKISEQRRKELYAKQGRGNQFSNREERDDWITRELKTLERTIRDKETQIMNLREDIRESKQTECELEGAISEKTVGIQEHKSTMDSLSRDSLNLKRHKDELQSQRQRLWRTETSIQQELDSITSEIKAKEHTLNSLIGKAAVHGTESLKKVRESFRQAGNMELVEGYKGMLIENFQCSPNFFTCVEVTAGGKLYNHIVTTDRIGTKYLNEMNKAKLPGEVTFLPLNKLEVRDVSYPQTADAIPMITKMQYDDVDNEAAMKYVFGKTLICRSMEVSTQLARAHQLDCVTLEGDQVSRRGALTGGYVDNRKSRLELHASKQSLLEQLKVKEKELLSNKEHQQQLEVESTGVMDELQKQETRNKQNKDVFDKLKGDLRILKEKLQAMHRALEPKERSLASLQSHCEALKSTKLSLEEEMGTDLLSQLSSDDQGEVDRLNDEIKLLTSEHKEMVQQRVRLESKKTSLVNLLEDNLIRRRDQLIQEMQELSVDVRQQKLIQFRNDQRITEEQLEIIDGRLKELEEEMISLEKEENLLTTKVEEHRVKEREWRERISDDARELEKATNKQSLLIKRREDCVRKIRDLGSVPQDAFDKYQGCNHRQLMKKLEECNHELKKYSHVNKKALDQFVSFSEEKERLLSRKDEIDRGKEAIVHLMEHLEHEKYEAIQFTFRQVSKNFSEVFVKLVPGGKATLIMRRGDATQDTSTQSSEQSASIVDQFVGVGIKVSFSGKAAETREMQQLSGGQKSLVALALIFAIQKCDPAPFYLFDEIDQALDPDHRSSVANMLRELSSSAQFITTTFRPELLDSADKFYGVVYRNKVGYNAGVVSEQGGL